MYCSLARSRTWSWTLVLVVSMSAAWVAGVGASVNSPSGLDAALTAVDNVFARNIANPRKLEEDCRALLVALPTDAQKGLVCAHIGRLYGEGRIPQPERGAQYCEEALSYPLPPHIAANAYRSWGMCAELATYTDDATQAGLFRRLAAERYLRGLKIMLDANAPATEPKAPPHPIDSTAGGFSEEYKHALDAADEEWAGRWRLWSARDDLMMACIFLYVPRFPKYDELGPLADCILAGHREVAKQLVDLLAVARNAPPGTGWTHVRQALAPPVGGEATPPK